MDVLVVKLHSETGGVGTGDILVVNVKVTDGIDETGLNTSRYAPPIAEDNVAHLFVAYEEQVK